MAHQEKHRATRFRKHVYSQFRKTNSGIERACRWAGHEVRPEARGGLDQGKGKDSRRVE